MRTASSPLALASRTPKALRITNGNVSARSTPTDESKTNRFSFPPLKSVKNKRANHGRKKRRSLSNTCLTSSCSLARCCGSPGNIYIYSSVDRSAVQQRPSTRETSTSTERFASFYEADGLRGNTIGKEDDLGRWTSLQTEPREKRIIYSKKEATVLDELSCRRYRSGWKRWRPCSG